MNLADTHLAEPTAGVTVSVVIPVKDDSAELAVCLQALNRQTRRADEIIVVDNASSDDSADTARAGGATVISCTRPGIPAASAAGYDAASGELILRLDADCVPRPGWIQDVVEAFDAQPDVAALTGPAEFIDGPALLRKPLVRAYLLAYMNFSIPALGHRPLFGSNLAMRRGAWQQVRLAVHREDPEIHDDLDLSFHLGEHHRLGQMDGEPMGISMRPFHSAKAFQRRIIRGFRSVTVHWPHDFPPLRWRRAWRRRRCQSSEPASTRDSALIGPVPAPALHVMSWNIRRRTLTLHPRRADHWQRRAPGVRAMLQTERPSLLGVQEALPDQVRFVAGALGESYRSVGHGRGPHGGGEASPIYYDAERLELLDWEQSALSETPHRPGSRSWGNLIPRILVTATFRDRETGARFSLLNTHLDHLSGRSRLRSAQSIRERVLSSPLPVLLTADMNVPGSSEPLEELLGDHTLRDTWTAAPRRESQEWGTFANYRAPRLDRRRIDWVLATPEVRVLRAAINTRRPRARWASDHLPVHAVLQLPQDAAPDLPQNDAALNPPQNGDLA